MSRVIEEPTTSACSEEPTTSTDKPLAQGFEIRWERAPAKVKRALEKKERLQPDVRKKLVQFVTDEIMEVC